MDSMKNKNGSNGGFRYQVETEDGWAISVPADKLDDWAKAQAEGPRPLNKAELRLRDRIVQEIYGSKK